jgi:co-chaperonin GroES (HSP10)
MSRIIGSENSKPEAKPPYTPPPIEPINDRIVVQADVIPELTKGGLALPNDAVGRRLSRYGTVLAVGPGALRVFREMRFTAQDGKDIRVDCGERFPMQCKVGDRVILPTHAERMTMDPDDRESELIILQESQLLAILR